MVFKALTIAGSDNSGGAGIQADLKVFSAFRVYGMSAVTSVTVQNSFGVIKSHPVSPDIVYSQIETVAQDIPVDSVKIGMLQSAGNVEAVTQALVDFNLKNIVLDTVIASKNGTLLLDRNAFDIFIKKLIPLADIITPNRDEAEIITGIKIKEIKDMKKAAEEIGKMGAKTVVIKGGHVETGSNVVDVIYNKKEFIPLQYPRVDTPHTHGTGCTFSSAIASCLARQMETVKAIRLARAYVQGAIENSLQTGRGTGSLNHFWTVM
ncbi:MAG: bifunctional hydroxymethylpyrimidine kinase/phosphomethylpyrimidine kinase [Aquificae bacterium]|nr:bifunctional hydroxymethylpyrimidine kinase/phosphomethylpyrimidine kinase [Aquificota bacterium]